MCSCGPVDRGYTIVVRTNVNVLQTEFITSQKLATNTYKNNATFYKKTHYVTSQFENYARQNIEH